MIDEQNFFDQPTRNDLTTYDNIQKMQQVKEMIMHVIVCWTVIILKTIIR